jgi:hypothetical protein
MDNGIYYINDRYQVRWFSPDPPFSSINKTDRHDITRILLKVVLNTIKQAKTNKHVNKILTNYAF